jgi:hypothetical protein
MIASTILKWPWYFHLSNTESHLELTELLRVFASTPCFLELFFHHSSPPLSYFLSLTRTLGLNLLYTQNHNAWTNRTKCTFYQRTLHSSFTLRTLFPRRNEKNFWILRELYCTKDFQSPIALTRISEPKYSAATIYSRDLYTGNI